MITYPNMITYPVTVGIVKFRDKILILRRSEKKKFFPDLWEFPGGKIKEKESAEGAI